MAIKFIVSYFGDHTGDCAEYVSIHKSTKKVSLDGDFTLDQLEQILTKMKELQGEESPLADLASKQEPLGEPFQTILNENIKDLYES